MSQSEESDDGSSSSEDEILKELELWEDSDSDSETKKGKKGKKKGKSKNVKKVDEAELKRRKIVRRGKSLVSQLDKNDKAEDKRPSAAFFKKKKFDAAMKSNQKLVNSFKNFCKGQGSRRFVKDNVHKILCRRYLSEICESICKSTLDPGHIPELVESCSVLHQYYEDFNELVVEELDQAMNWVDPDENLLGHVFFTVELFLVGLYDDEGKVFRFIKDFLLLNQHTELRIRFARTFLEIYGPQFTLLEVPSPYRKDIPFLACSLNKEEEKNVECLFDDKYLKELTKLFKQFTLHLQKRMLKYIRRIEKKIMREKVGTKKVKKEKGKDVEGGEEEEEEEGKTSEKSQEDEEKEKEKEKKGGEKEEEKVKNKEEEEEEEEEEEGDEKVVEKEVEPKEKEEEKQGEEEGKKEKEESKKDGDVEKQTEEGKEEEGKQEKDGGKEEVEGEEEEEDKKEDKKEKLKNEGEEEEAQEEEEDMDVIKRWTRQIVLVGKEERQRKNKIIEMEGGVRKSLADLKQMSDLSAIPMPEDLEGRVQKILEDIEEFRKYLKDNRQSFRGKQFEIAEKKFYEKVPNINNVLGHLQRVKMSQEAKTNRIVETSSKPLSDILGEKKDNKNGGKPSEIVPPRRRNKLDLLLDRLPKSLEKQEQLDWCVNYCQYGPASHRRLVRKLYNVSRTSLELLPYYSRIVAILLPLYKEVSTMLVSDLLDQFNTLYEQKDPIKIETKVKNIRFLGELCKFRIVPPNIILDCLSACLDNFSSHNVNISCELLECCGRFLCFHRSHAFLARQLVARMMQLAEKKRLNQHFQNMIESAFFSCQMIKPENTKVGKDREAPTLHRYIYHLLYSELTDETKKKVFSRLRRLPWSDPALEAAFHYAAQNIANCEFERVHLVASVISGLLKWYPKIGVVVVDRVLDDIRSSMAGEIQLSYQKRYVDLKFFGELYNYKVISADLVMRVLYLLIMYCPQTDSPANTFRIRLTCILLETVGPYLEGKLWNRKLDRFLLYFQRYILSKKIRLPVDLENNVGTTLKLIRKKLKWPKNLKAADRKISYYEEKYGNKYSVTPTQTKLFPIQLDGDDEEDGEDDEVDMNEDKGGEDDEEDDENKKKNKNSDDDDNYSEHNLMDDMVREQREKEQKRRTRMCTREELELDDLINQMITDPLGVTDLGGPQFVVNVKKKKKPMIRLGPSSELLKSIHGEEKNENEIEEEEKEKNGEEEDEDYDVEYSEEEEELDDEDDEDEDEDEYSEEEEELYDDDVDDQEEGKGFRIMSKNDRKQSPLQQQQQFQENNNTVLRKNNKKNISKTNIRRRRNEVTVVKKKEKTFMDPSKSQKFTLISKVKGKQHRGKIMFIPKDIFN